MERSYQMEGNDLRNIERAVEKSKAEEEQEGEED
jgi:hypothetical protein